MYTPIHNITFSNGLLAVGLLCSCLCVCVASVITLGCQLSSSGLCVACVSFDWSSVACLLLRALHHVAVSDGGRGAVFVYGRHMSLCHSATGIFTPDLLLLLLLVLPLHTELGHIWILRTRLVGLFSVPVTLKKQVCRCVCRFTVRKQKWDHRSQLTSVTSNRLSRRTKKQQ